MDSILRVFEVAMDCMKLCFGIMPLFIGIPLINAGIAEGYWQIKANVSFF
jgi:hypothetical protein